MAKWIAARVKSRTDWNDHLFSLAFDCAEFPPFKAGQFTKIGLQQDGKIVSRPYSLVNSPAASCLEIIAVPVEGGLLSPKLHDLQVDDDVLIMSPATGFLTLEEVPASDNLWLLATGTGVGPFLSILSGEQVWQRYKHITLVYGMRHSQDLAYGPLIDSFLQNKGGQFNFVPVISREAVTGALPGRIPELLKNGSIQQQVAQTLNAQESQVMLCGNPDMIQDSISVLTELGLQKHLRRSPGQISMERYW